MANMICKFCFNSPSPKSDYLELPCVLPFPRRVTPSLPLFPTHHCQLYSHVCSSGSLLNLCWWLYRAKICHKLPVRSLSVSICTFLCFQQNFKNMHTQFETPKQTYPKKSLTATFIYTKVNSDFTLTWPVFWEWPCQKLVPSSANFGPLGNI